MEDKQRQKIINLKFFVLKNKYKLSLAMIFLIAVFLVSLQITKADVANFYPSSCLGGWQNPQNAQGKPDLEKEATIADFNETNSAVLKNTISQIFCGNFEGEAQKDSKAKKAILKFSWAIGAGNNSIDEIKNSGEATTSDLIQIIEIKNPAATSSDIMPESSSTPSSTEEKPVSFWRSIISDVFAQETDQSNGSTLVDQSAIFQEATSSQLSTEQISTSSQNGDKENTTTTNIFSNQDYSSTSVSTPETSVNLFEILYTVDGENWKSLGKVNLNNWKNLELEIPDFNWDDISKFQISIKSLSPVDFEPTVYLDGLWLEVEYEPTQKESNIQNETAIMLQNVSNNTQEATPVPLSKFTADKSSYANADTIKISGAPRGSAIEIYWLDNPDTAENTDMNSKPSNVYAVVVNDDGEINIDASSLPSGKFVFVNTFEPGYCSGFYLSQCRERNDYLGEVSIEIEPALSQ